MVTPGNRPTDVSRNAGNALTKLRRALFTNCILDRRYFSQDAEKMSSLKTLALTFAVVFAAAPALSTGSLHQLFAGCAGRFSAEMEHAWLMGKVEADLFEDRRRTFLSLVEAVMPADSARDVLRHRIENKMAHASLLTISTFGSDPKLAEAANSAARAYRLGCERILLDG